MRVKEFMHQGLDRVGLGCTVRQAARMMRRKNIGVLAVCRGDFLRGMVTDRDIVVRAIARGKDPAEITVGEIMTRRPARCYSESKLDAAVRLMGEARIRRIPVVDREERLVGMLSIDDLTRRARSRGAAADVLRSAAANHA